MAGTLEYGARFKLRRTTLSDSTVIYEVTVERHEITTLVYALELTLGGEKTVHQVSPIGEAADAPAWITKHVGTLGRQLAKGDSWPRLYQRWRADP
ncbi:MAG: hypothetical protein ACI81R_001220 [Bradymonadia bacterium]|jgi:hypothetical protein